MTMAACTIHDDRFPSSSLDSGSHGENTTTIRIDREHVVFPAHPSQHHRIHLSAFDLNFLLIHYNQRGLLYEMPTDDFSSAVTLLETSLSQVLESFYPLAGRLATSPSDGAIFIDCNDAGVAFIEASAENVLSIADVMATEVTTTIMDQLFALNGAINIEGHRLPLLTVQLTKLRDGIFVACTFNHAVGDGTCFWLFLHAWAEICRQGNALNLSIHPIYDRCGIPSNPNRSSVRLNLELDKDIGRFCRPLRTKIFHFTKEMIIGLKNRANSGRKSLQLPISSLQALCGHVWLAITRARGLGRNDQTKFGLAFDCRSRLLPTLPAAYFGNAIQVVSVTSTAWEVVSNEVSFPAQLLHGVIKSHGDKSIRKEIDEWEKNPTLFSLGNVGNTVNNPLLLGGSPRFNVYQTDFGWGKPVAIRSGCANKIDGKLYVCPGREQDGSVDLEISLVPETMSALEVDRDFLDPSLVGSM
ncbi:unnamed protein product [Calypogeia fissa]